MVEANDYLGGRTKSTILNNCVFDEGGEFIGPSQKYVIELANESGNELMNVNDKGTKVVDLKEGYYAYSGSIPNIGSLVALVDMQVLILKIDRMASKLSIDNPRDCPLGYRWDSISAQKWIDENAWCEKIKVML